MRKEKIIRKIKKETESKLIKQLSETERHRSANPDFLAGVLYGLGWVLEEEEETEPKDELERLRQKLDEIKDETEVKVKDKDEIEDKVKDVEEVEELVNRVEEIVKRVEQVVNKIEQKKASTETTEEKESDEEEKETYVDELLEREEDEPEKCIDKVRIAIKDAFDDLEGPLTVSTLIEEAKAYWGDDGLGVSEASLKQYIYQVIGELKKENEIEKRGYKGKEAKYVKSCNYDLEKMRDENRELEEELIGNNGR